ncbi:membrane-spanning 4-domains subfamily A member 4A-like [Branchiostoma lanceolatum]|uniref:membrane-spanning 4-domains subfamily A member 4A-like n=1 Tax=Branchiostoma lanceolatum TaxID=7740 RepID=UPI0034525338
MFQQQPARSPRCFGNSAAKALSITQVVCGGIAIVLGVVIIVILASNSYTGYPIWIGALFLSTGIVGIFAAVRKTTCMMIAFMVLSILSAFFTSVMLWLAAVAVSWDQWRTSRWCWISGSYVPCHNTVPLVMDALLILLALLEAGLSITTAVMTCCAVCPCCKAGGSDNCCSCDNQSYQPPAVAYQVGAGGRLVQIPGQYTMQAEGNVVIIPAGQQTQGGAPVQPAQP